MSTKNRSKFDSVPGEPYPIENEAPPAPAPAPPLVATGTDQNNHKGHVPYLWIIGSFVVCFALIVAVALLFICKRSSYCFLDLRGDRSKDPEDAKAFHKFHILRTSFCCGSRRLSRESDDWRQNIGESSDRHMNLPKVIGTDVFDLEKPVVFLYEEILLSTDDFSESNLLGHGTYGAVYHGLLRDQLVGKLHQLLLRGIYLSRQCCLHGL